MQIEKPRPTGAAAPRRACPAAEAAARDAAPTAASIAPRACSATRASRGCGSATVTVFGVGGVGSFAAEALARTGVGRIILVDFDRICVTNTNRQLHAMKGTLGKPKVEVMAERLRAINPDAVIEARREFYSEKSSQRLLVPEPDVVVDAIDNVTAKLHLIATCIRERLRLVSSMGAAARLDPTRVRVADLAETRVDPFAKHVRKDLRRKYGLDCSRARSACCAVYSEEPPRAPVPLTYDTEGFLVRMPGRRQRPERLRSRQPRRGLAALRARHLRADPRGDRRALLCDSDLA